MKRTNNLNVRGMTPIIAPSDLKQVFPLSELAAEFVSAAREEVKEVMSGRSGRLMAVVGPCSIHDPDAALDYARRLARLAQEVRGELLVVMRVYFEKPRTTIGWKGLINDPDLNGTHQISKGLGVARRLLCSITDLGLPVATEMLDPITPQYLSDLVSWAAIGARTTESQPHREMASGLSFPVGFKNGTDGNLQIAIDGMAAARHPHSFLGVNHEGRTSVVQTTGNADVHIVLRGGNNEPNYSVAHVRQTEELLHRVSLPRAIMVDCSHANSGKHPERQEGVLREVLDQIIGGASSLFGVMIESNLEAGSQPIPKHLSHLRYGVSITDACVGWEATERMLREAAERLRSAGGRRIREP
jgi:3-deoxy-7-phosphoheptulonate synthase